MSIPLLKTVNGSASMKLKHFHSDTGTGTPSSKTPYNDKPSVQTVRKALSLGRIAVGNADIFAQDGKYIVVIVRVPNGISANYYRDMYKIA